MTAVEHVNRRLVVALPESYDDAVTRYEALVPEISYAAFAAAHSWAETLDIAEAQAPHGFLRYYSGDVTAAMAGSGSRWRATQYLMGNHTIAERMYRHDPAVMLHAPLRTVIYLGADGVPKFAVDQPSMLFDSYGAPEISAVGRYLDDLLGRLIALLGADVPETL